MFERTGDSLQGAPCSFDLAQAQSIVASAVHSLTNGTGTTSSFHSIEDLRQEGMEALIRATSTFDETRCVPFPVYARKAVSYALLRYLRATDPLPERSRRDLRKIKKAEAAFLLQGTENPTAVQVSQASGLPLERVLRVRRECYETSTQYFCPAGPDLDFPGLPGDTPEDRIILWESRENIRSAILSLTTRQREIFHLRFLEQLSVTETAERLGISKGRVSQLTAAVEATLRAAIQGDTPPAQQQGHPESLSKTVSA